MGSELHIHSRVALRNSTGKAADRRRFGVRTVVPSLLALVATIFVFPQASAAQCISPNLIVNDTTCVAGQACEVSVDLDSNGEAFAGALATMSSDGPITCDACEPGQQAGGICVLNAETCTWNVSDFSLQAFGDGEVARISIVCEMPGSYFLDLSDASLGRTTGIPELSCGLSGALTCENCSSDDQCDDGNACTLEDSCTDGACMREDFCGVPASRGASPVASDALFTLRAAIAVEPCPLCECDVDSNGATTASDALAVLQKSVGLPTELVCFAADPL